ncbi:MAG: ABC transporter substrate-binding protein [Proteobacteria bacterium]|nr:ABC transporter substrate-binding protein [Pseudomonadota bacterium]
MAGVKRSFLMLVVAIILGLTGLAAAFIYTFAAPTVLRIAVGPVGSDDTKAVVTILQTFAREKHPIRLRLVPTDGPTGSAELLRQGRVDAAVVRSDGNVPPNAATVAILHRDAFLVMAPRDKGITALEHLAGRKVGIARGFNLNSKFLDLLLERNGIDPAKVTRVPVAPPNIRHSIQDGSLDAILVVGPPAGGLLGRVFNDLFDAEGRPPVLIPASPAEAIAQRNPAFDTLTVLRGIFGGTPPLPSSDIMTLSVTHRLVVDRSLSESTVGDLAKSLFDVRQTVAAEVPGFARIEAPNTEVLGPLVVHAGAAAYFDGERKSFIEEYGEWIYISVMVVGLLGSLIAALFSRHMAQARPAGKTEIDKMLMLLRRARSAKTTEELDRVQHDADDAFSRTLERAAGSDIDEAVLSAFTIALSEVRTAVDERRTQLSHELGGMAG